MIVNNGTFFDASKELEAGYKNQAWRNPRVEGVKPIADKEITSFADWKRFVIEHELAHADFPRRAPESLSAYENRINRVALRRMRTSSKKITPYDVQRLRRSGISESMATRIADQAETYGLWGDYVRIARTHLWDDQEAAQIYRSALGKDINETIITPGKGDLPNVMGGGLKHIIPEKFRKGDNVTERGRLLSSEEYLTPDEILKKDPLFKPMRSS